MHNQYMVCQQQTSIQLDYYVKPTTIIQLCCVKKSLLTKWKKNNIHNSQIIVKVYIQSSTPISDWLCEKGSQLFQIPNFSDSNISPQEFKLSPSYYTKLQWYVNGMLGSSFKSSAKLKSSVTGLQICAIGISYKAPFHRANHLLKSIK